ncbi:MAG: A24 family peptidase [Planctomycetota bacterium]|nr:A24 family peptidase [Planctomycetota bacterium]
MSLATVLLLGFVLVATVTDTARHRIYNWTTYPGILIALAIAGVVSICGSSGGATKWVGSVEFSDSVSGLLACGGCMLLCVIFFEIGGGDVKLIAMLGAFLGLRPGIEAMLWSFVIGAAFAIVVLIWKVGTLNVLRRFIQYALAAFRLRGVSPLKGSLDAQFKTSLFLAPSTLLAVILVEFKLLKILGLDIVV